jgi:hypothetical protein
LSGRCGCGTTERGHAWFRWLRADGDPADIRRAKSLLPYLRRRFAAVGDAIRWCCAMRLVEIEEFVRVAVLLLYGDCVLAPKHRRQFN